MQVASASTAHPNCDPRRSHPCQFTAPVPGTDHRAGTCTEVLPPPKFPRSMDKIANSTTVAFATTQFTTAKPIHSLDGAHAPTAPTATMRPTQALSVGKYRHLKMTTKDVGRGFYKGNRTGAMGRHTKYGTYVIEWEKVRTYAVPDLKEFKVRSQPTEVAKERC